MNILNFSEFVLKYKHPTDKQQKVAVEFDHAVEALWKELGGRQATGKSYLIYCIEEYMHYRDMSNGNDSSLKAVANETK